MSKQKPKQDRTLVIMFGASEWPLYPEFDDLPGAKNSAEAVRDYFLDDKGFGLPPENLWYLFNAEETPPIILTEMSRFLRRRIGELRDLGQPAQDIIVYYVGHGGFANPTNDYFLAVCSTMDTEPYISSIPVISLAKTLKEETRHLRRYLILDSCFSGAASRSFQASGPVQIAAKKTGDSFPPSGTAILCSSGARDPSKAPPELTYTMFSGALLDVLRGGSDTVPKNLTLQDLAHLTRLKLREDFEDEGVRPEVHAPEQKLGNVDEVPLFPNPIKQGVTKDSSDEEQHEIKDAKKERKRTKRQTPQKQKPATVMRRDKEFHDQLKDGSNGPEMVAIPAGYFQMGDTWGTGNEVENPVHPVEITKPFAMGKYAVSFAQYDSFCMATGRSNMNDAGWGRGQHPVINVSWEDTISFTKWLCEQTGRHYRLPTESEWEYAARAGKETDYWWGNEIGENRANCDGCSNRSQKKTKLVKSCIANPFGLYNILGNAFEWVQDNWHDSYRGAPRDGSAWISGERGKRVIRGGSWFSSPSALRCAYRSANWANYRSNEIGFRLACTL